LWNDKVLKISKNYGIIHGFDFTLFSIETYSYYTYQEYTLAGLSNPAVGIQNLTRLNVWDFEPGDELHIYERALHYSQGTEKKQIIKYLSRENTENKISYKVDVKEDLLRRESVDDVWKETVQYNHYETTEEISPDEEFDKLPGEVMIFENSADINAMYYDGGILYKTLRINEITNFNDDQCWDMIIACGGCLSSDYYYQNGLGGPYYNCGGPDIWERSLVYYKKGDTVWGNPLALTEIKEIKAKTSSVVYDQSGEAFLIHLESANPSCLFELIDATGKTMIQRKLTPARHSIPTGHLPNGLYIYRLTENGKTILSEKIIK
jgi:hypothetical protein